MTKRGFNVELTGSRSEAEGTRSSASGCPVERRVGHRSQDE